MDAIAIDELITKGVKFTLTADATINTYRSYQYNRGTYIKFVRLNGDELHLGRYTPDGMNFNKKFRAMRQSRQSMPYVYLKWFLESVKECQMNKHIIFNVVGDSTPPLVLTKEEKVELLDTQEYLYRIGVIDVI